MFWVFQVEIPNYSFWFYWVLLHDYNFARLFLCYQSSIDKWDHWVAEQDQLCWAGRSQVKKGTILKQEQLSNKEPMNCLLVYLNFTYHYAVMRQSPHFCTIKLDQLLTSTAQYNYIDATNLEVTYTTYWIATSIHLGGMTWHWFQMINKTMRSL